MAAAAQRIVIFPPHPGMNPTRDTRYPIIDTVLHPTDFSEASLVRTLADRSTEPASTA